MNPYESPVCGATKPRMPYRVLLRSFAVLAFLGVSSALIYAVLGAVWFMHGFYIYAVADFAVSVLILIAIAMIKYLFSTLPDNVEQ